MAVREDINLNDRGTSGGVAARKNLTRQSSVPVLWDTFRAEKSYHLLSYRREEDFYEWCVEKAHSLDRSCVETKFDESSLDHEGLANALMCDHRDGSFALTPEAVGRCHHVANVISVSCFLICLRIGTFEDKDGSVIDKSTLIDHLASLMDKWKWSGEQCKQAFDLWTDVAADMEDKLQSRYKTEEKLKLQYKREERLKLYEMEETLLKLRHEKEETLKLRYEMEETLKLLYQWTLPFLSATFVNVECVIMRASEADAEYADVDWACKWGNELCDFLGEYRNLFKVSSDIEFFYDEMYAFYQQTAKLHRILGKHERAGQLLVALRNVLDDVSDDIKVTDWGHCKNIAYIEPDRIALLDRKINVLTLLSNYCSEEFQKDLDECESTRKELGFTPKVCNFLDWSMSLYGDRIYRIFSYFGEMRLSEARESFKDFIVMKANSLNTSLRDLHDFLYSIENIGDFIRHSCSRSTLKWEAVREKQDFLLDVCEASGDRQLTAKYLAHCGWMIYWQYCNLFKVEDASTAKLQLQEGLNMQPTLPAPECVQYLISSLKDPCKPDEHKRDNLPDLLRGFRLINCAIKIYSDLLHSWTQSTSKEVKWLELLESQKGVHSMMLAYHLGVMALCKEAIFMSSNANLPRESRIEQHSLICMEPVESVAHGGRNLSTHRIFQIVSAACLNSALVWVERGRARTLMKQLGGGDGPYSASLKGELIEFDNNYQAAESSIRSCQSACKGDPLFIEYHCPTSKLPSFMGRFRVDAFVVHKYGTVHESVMHTRDDDEVKKLVDRFYDEVPQLRTNASVVGELHSILEELYDILVEPIFKNPALTYLDPNAMLVIVPDKTLYRVPFSLLRDKNSQKYLFQLRPIAISPSLRVLQHCDRRWHDLENFPLKPDGCILAVGNATYEPHRRLPGTGQELEQLKESFPGRVKMLQEDEATCAKFLELVKQASCSKEQHVFAFIHLGVHGCWSKPDPFDDEKNQCARGSLQFAKPSENRAAVLQPSIADHSRDDLNEFGVAQYHPLVQMEQELIMEAASSADGERQGSSFGEIGAVTRVADFKSTTADGMLSSEDIVKGGFQWRTPLVVLSACESSRGQDYSDGEVNLPRALMIAGVPAAVVSQWKIGDSASFRLMAALYRNLKCGQNVARALQSAMMQLSAPESGNADNIFAWGPFLVWGLPNVQLPQELWTEKARKALPAREKAELLRCKLNDLDMAQHNAFKLNLFQELQAVDHFLEYFASCNASALGDEAVKLKAVIGVEELLSRLSCLRFSKFDILEVISALAEQFYAVLLPLEEMKVVELELEKHCTESFMVRFWAHMMYTQAMRGKHEIALAYCNKLIEVGNKREACNRKTKLLDMYVILGLMGKYEEAFEGFDDFLAQEESYNCLIQTSYLKYLMKDEIGALVYALRVKMMGDAKIDKPSYGRLGSLVVNALPDETFCQWLLNVKESTLTEKERKVLAAKEQVLLLGREFRSLALDEEHLRYLKDLKLVDTFLASVYSGALDKNAVVDAILAAESLLSLSNEPLVSKESIAVTEGFYTIFIFDQLNWVELELEKQPGRERLLIYFRLRLMYVQATKGSLQIALDYANKMIEIAHNADGCGYPGLVVQEFRKYKDFVRQERAVILRLMGKYDEALRELESLLAAGEDYELLIETSYLKHLMEDKGGALEYALRAKKVVRPYIHEPGYCPFQLCGFKTLPNEYWLWLLNADDRSAGPTSSSVAGMSRVPPELCTEKAIPARTAVHPKPLYTPNCPSFCTEGI